MKFAYAFEFYLKHHLNNSHKIIKINIKNIIKNITLSSVSELPTYSKFIMKLKKKWQLPVTKKIIGKRTIKKCTYILKYLKSIILRLI